MKLSSQNYYEDINVGQTIGPFVKNIDRKQKMYICHYDFESIAVND